LWSAFDLAGVGCSGHRLLNLVFSFLAIETYPDQLEPDDQEAVIWRFMDMTKFRDLIQSGELYFRRADLFANDEREGLPLEEHLHILGLNPFDIRDRQELCNHLGSDAQFRESFYVSCWHLFREETHKMWKEYGREGVAICSRYRFLKSALNELSDRAFLGLVRYGPKHPTRWNILNFITTKRLQFEREKEVRAILWIFDAHAGINRHIDANGRIHPAPLTPPPDHVPDGQRRKMQLQSLITEVIVTPWAGSTIVGEVSELLTKSGYAIPVRSSDLTRYRDFMPGPEDNLT
jgi:hypothetical protein